MDRVFLRDLRVETVIGVWDWERRINQTVSVDLELAVDAAKAAQSDAVEDTVSYKEVADGVARVLQEGQFKLVETAAQRIAEYVLSEHRVAWVRVSVSKPGAVRAARDVGVTIERGDANQGSGGRG